MERWKRESMYGIVLCSNKIGPSVVSTTHHPHGDPAMQYLTRIFGGFLGSARVATWTSNATEEEAFKTHNRYCNWIAKMEGIPR